MRQPSRGLCRIFLQLPRAKSHSSHGLWHVCNWMESITITIPLWNTWYKEPVSWTHRAFVWWCGLWLLWLLWPARKQLQTNSSSSWQREPLQGCQQWMLKDYQIPYGPVQCFTRPFSLNYRSSKSFCFQEFEAWNQRGAGLSTFCCSTEHILLDCSSLKRRSASDTCSEDITALLNKMSVQSPNQAQATVQMTNMASLTAKATSSVSTQAAANIARIQAHFVQPTSVKNTCAWGLGNIEAYIGRFSTSRGAVRKWHRMHSMFLTLNTFEYFITSFISWKNVSRATREF